MSGFEDDPDPEVHSLVAYARVLGWSDEQPSPLPPIEKETWDEGGWPVTRISFGTGHMLAAGLHPRDFNTTPEERLEHRVAMIEKEALAVLQHNPARIGATPIDRRKPRTSEFELGSQERIAEEILDLAALARSMIRTRESVARLGETLQRLAQKRIALRDMVQSHPADGPNGRTTVKLTQVAAAQSAGPRRRKPKWLRENKEKLTEMHDHGASAWKMAGFIARKYNMDQNSLSSLLKKLIAAGEFTRSPQIY